MKTASFKKLWKSIKNNLTDQDIDLYLTYKPDPNLSASMRAFNPIYKDFFFMVGRCHWNVILPAYILNNRQLEGNYKIITSDKHSAIYCTKTNLVFDPTYEFNGIVLEEAISNLQESKLVELKEHLKDLSIPL